MRVLINHLTRMHGGHICVAGVDLKTRRHVRPLLADGPLPFYLLARYGGPFEMAWIVDLGSPRPAPVAPHVEDHVFVPARAKAERPAAAHEFWSLLEELRQPRLREIFGPALSAAGGGRYGTEVEQGLASLGFLQPAAPPHLYLARSRDGKPQVRMKFSDGQIEADASVTDLRLFGSDHATPDQARIRAVAEAMADSPRVILGLGLTRKFRPSDDAAYRHWLQVNNIHLRDDPIWRLG
jgi:hypothetical protein